LFANVTNKVRAPTNVIILNIKKTHSKLFERFIQHFGCYVFSKKIKSEISSWGKGKMTQITIKGIL
jgi:hypothetical protein